MTFISFHFQSSSFFLNFTPLLLSNFLGKRDIDGRLATAQTALMVQEETIRRKERERKALSDKVGALERSVASLESEKRQLQVCKMKVENVRH